jgi:hypothetical protein
VSRDDSSSSIGFADLIAIAQSPGVKSEPARNSETRAKTCAALSAEVGMPTETNERNEPNEKSPRAR